MHIPPTLTVITDKREYGENNITAGLLYQSLKGRIEVINPPWVIRSEERRVGKECRP